MAAIDLRITARLVRPWRCYRCGTPFAHGRLLAGHLLDVHGEAR